MLFVTIYIDEIRDICYFKRTRGQTYSWKKKKKKKKKAKLLSYANYPYPSFPSAPLLSQKLKTCFLERKVIKLLCSITNII